MITKNAVRVFENKQIALSLYGKPVIAVPFNAIEKIERIKFDFNDDTRMENVDPITMSLNKNMFEFILKDDFLPIYTHHNYLRIFKDTSIAMDMSPDRRRSTSNMMSSSSPRKSTLNSRNDFDGSRLSSTMGRLSMGVNLHKKTGQELKDSPSKNSKIVMKYINTYQDVGPLVSPKSVT